MECLYSVYKLLFSFQQGSILCVFISKIPKLSTHTSVYVLVKSPKLLEENTTDLPFFFTDIVSGDCRWYPEWSNDEKKDAHQECNKEEVMVGIKKTYFDGWNEEDDWKYQIRCCKVSNFS